MQEYLTNHHSSQRYERYFSFQNDHILKSKRLCPTSKPVYSNLCCLHSLESGNQMNGGISKISSALPGSTIQLHGEHGSDKKLSITGLRELVGREGGKRDDQLMRAAEQLASPLSSSRQPTMYHPSILCQLKAV